jgi:hypothetical protein
MKRRSLNTLATVCWTVLLLSVVVLFLFALLTPEVALFSSTSQRDQEIRSIKAETDISRLQQMATMYVSAGYGTGATATLLCRVALVTELLVVAGSVASLVQIRRLRQANQTLQATAAAPGS